MMQETYKSPKPDNLFAANQVMPVVTGRITVNGVNATRGMLLTKNGVDAVGIDDAWCVAAEDGTDGETIAVYLTGEFNAAAILPGANDGDIVANRIFIKKNLEA